MPFVVTLVLLVHRHPLEVRDKRRFGSLRYVEIYSPMTLASGQSYTLALPFIVQGRQITAQVNDLATTIYMLLARARAPIQDSAPIPAPTRAPHRGSRG